MPPGSLAVCDFCLPVIGRVTIGPGIAPTVIAMDDLPVVDVALMTPKTMHQALAKSCRPRLPSPPEGGDILFGDGEWVTAGLVADLPDLDWIIPETGAVH